MTDRKKALEALLEKVEAGRLDWPHAQAYSHHSQLSEADVWSAFIGSLDAAKALHEAVLPWWVATVKVGGNVAGRTYTYCEIEDLEEGDEIASGSYELPARAWLDAILRALIEQEGGE